MHLCHPVNERIRAIGEGRRLRAARLTRKFCCPVRIALRYHTCLNTGFEYRIFLYTGFEFLKVFYLFECIAEDRICRLYEAENSMAVANRVVHLPSLKTKYLECALCLLNPSFSWKKRCRTHYAEGSAPWDVASRPTSSRCPTKLAKSSGSEVKRSETFLRAETPVELRRTAWPTKILTQINWSNCE